MTSTVLDFLLSRRSSKPALLEAPGPSEEELTRILTAAARVPDHKKLTPWRFVVFAGEARAAFGEKLCQVCLLAARLPPQKYRKFLKFSGAVINN